MAKQFEFGDIVSTPLGNGKVLYKRMKAPDYAIVEAYSVAVGSNSNGAIFPAEQVSEAKSQCYTNCVRSIKNN